MKLDSKYFDKVRVKPGEERMLRDRLPPCQWPGCAKLGRHLAPKGRNRDGEYHVFCMEHVQQYNRGYNYFEGMNDADLAAWQKAALTGHRPTWQLGQTSGAAQRAGRRIPPGRFPPRNGRRFDPFGLFGEAHADAATQAHPGRVLRNGELKALHTLGLDESATPEKAKSQYKLLVKRLHPDANGGSRANEETLKAVIQAYDHLRSTGFC